MSWSDPAEPTVHDVLPAAGVDDLIRSVVGQLEMLDAKLQAAERRAAIGHPPTAVLSGGLTFDATDADVLAAIEQARVRTAAGVLPARPQGAAVVQDIEVDDDDSPFWSDPPSPVSAPVLVTNRMPVIPVEAFLPLVAVVLVLVVVLAVMR